MRRALLGCVLVVLCAPATAAGAATALQRSDAARWALRQVGVKERGTTNCGNPVSLWQRDMGLGLRPCRPWCGAFVHQAFLRQGIRLSARLIDPDRTYGDILAGRRGLRRIAAADVRRGDLLLFKIRPGLRASHMAIVTSAPRDGVVRTVEGNNGHAVRRDTHYLTTPVLAARIVGSA